MSTLDQEPIEDPDAVAARVGAQVEEMAGGDAAYWAIRRAADGAFIGFCELFDIDRRRDTAEIRFAVAREGWGQGFGQEALSALLAQIAADGLKAITARVHVGDVPAERLLAKLGFRPDGYMKGAVHRDGERRDRRIYGLRL
ncbi:acetyltransferase, GNAT family [Caulobacter vibrioides CB15]|uniref:Acetyltransferase, GNAT family n=2 Tax=Caulobacter vibrioides TaxID=155892 RepID=Q9A7K5_CAUVC|nr:acetyltransferase, GNAT family [Caulobacter vibrioides CB15]